MGEEALKRVGKIHDGQLGPLVAAIEAKNVDKAFVFWMAEVIHFQSWCQFKKLKDSNIDLTIKDEEGNNLYHYLAKSTFKMINVPQHTKISEEYMNKRSVESYLGVLRVLWDVGIDVNQLNTDGLTALDVAKASENTAFVKALESVQQEHNTQHEQSFFEEIVTFAWNCLQSQPVNTNTKQRQSQNSMR